MKFSIHFTAEGRNSLQNLSAHIRAEILAVIESVLTHLPAAESKSRIKKLAGNFTPPLYRLRVGEYRVFYIVEGDKVGIMHACHKDHTQEYYDSLNQGQ